MTKKLSHIYAVMKRLSFDTYIWSLSVIGGAILLCFSFFFGAASKQMYGEFSKEETVGDQDRIIEYSSIFGNLKLDDLNDTAEISSCIPESIQSDVEGFDSIEEALKVSGVLDLESSVTEDAGDASELETIVVSDNSESVIYDDKPSDEEDDSEVDVTTSDAESDSINDGLFGNDVLVNDEVLAISISEELDAAVDVDVVNEYSVEEVELLGRLVQCEAQSEDLQGRILIANVVMNRVESGIWGNTITDVILSKGQFDPIMSGAYKTLEPDDITKEAVLIALNGQNNSNGALYFQKSRSKQWGNKEYLFRYGSHSFYR